MDSLKSFKVICTTSGTILHGEDCVIVFDEDITEEEWEYFLSDSEMCDLAKERGTYIKDLLSDQNTNCHTESH